MSEYLTQKEISRIIATLDYRNLPNSASKGAKLYNEQAVRHEDVVQAGVCTEGQLKRGIRAMNEHREIGVAHRPGKLTHSDEQELLTYCLEKIQLD
ncbi:hypothetical protein BLNAU_11819 [Blattamonas nauphoetae]|uniref:Uncharacterized protein n=1 Tax=Blattamonas nauphoetae TaxID=2049346 RepID=A0ABQ9XN65_9EUKA|nr:hypothetical protein BLNAU_11819 [Blattamonas nauphoetae]